LKNIFTTNNLSSFCANDKILFYTINKIFTAHRNTLSPFTIPNIFSTVKDLSNPISVILSELPLITVTFCQIIQAYHTILKYSFCGDFVSPGIHHITIQKDYLFCLFLANLNQYKPGIATNVHQYRLLLHDTDLPNMRPSSSFDNYIPDRSFPQQDESIQELHHDHFHQLQRDDMFEVTV